MTAFIFVSPCLKLIMHELFLIWCKWYPEDTIWWDMEDLNCERTGLGFKMNGMILCEQQAGRFDTSTVFDACNN